MAISCGCWYLVVHFTNVFAFSCILKARWLASKEKGQIIDDSPQSVSADSSPQGALGFLVGSEKSKTIRKRLKM